MMGAVAFQKGLGVCHSLAHPLSCSFVLVLVLVIGLGLALGLPRCLNTSIMRRSMETTAHSSAAGWLFQPTR